MGYVSMVILNIVRFKFIDKARTEANCRQTVFTKLLFYNCMVSEGTVFKQRQFLTTSTIVEVFASEINDCETSWQKVLNIGPEKCKYYM